MTVDPDQVIERARAALRGVYDPEIGLDIVALGLVYDVRLEGSRLEVDMTLTTEGCPVAESLPNEAADAVANALSDVDLEVAVRVVWDPPWTPELIDREAAEAAGLRLH